MQLLRIILQLSAAVACLPLLAPPALPAPPAPAIPTALAPTPKNLKPTAVEPYLRQAQLRSCKNDYQNALQYCDLALARDPSCGRAYLYRGYALFKLEKPADAVASIKKGLALLPNKGEGVGIVPGRGPEETYHILVCALVDLSNYKEALYVLENIPAGYMTKFAMWEDKGSVYFYLNEFEKAAACYSKAMVLDPTNPYLLRERGKALMKAKKFKEAAADFTAAVKLEPDESSLYALRAQCYKVLGRQDLAAKDMEKTNNLGKMEDFFEP